MFRVLLIALLCAFASSLQLGAPRTRRDVFSALAASPLVLGAVAANAAEAKAVWAIRPGIAGMTEKVPAVAKGCNVEKPCDKGATFPYSEVSDKPARGPIKK